MPKTKKTLLPLNLKKYNVYIEDTSETSEYFNISRLPTTFTGGRNSFLIGGSRYLQNGSQVLIEITDTENNVIYQSMVQNYSEGNSRMISVEIYDTIKSGFATITIMGKAGIQSNGRRIPRDWLRSYNVRWTKKILVDYNLKNVSPIKFLNSPTLTAVENIFYNVNSSSFDTITIPLTASLSPLIISPVQKGYLIQVEGMTKFQPQHLNGKITGSISIQSSVPTILNIPISKIKNDTFAIGYGGLISSSINGGIIKKISRLTSGSYTASIDGVQYPITSSAALQYNVISTSSVNIPISYSNLRIFNMNTVSGEIHKLRIYNKIPTNPSDYKLIADVLVNTSEILVSSSKRGNVAIGNIYTTQNYKDNWYSGELVKNTGRQFRLYTTSGSATYYDSSINTNRFILSSSEDILLSSIHSYVPIDLSTNKFSNQISESGYFIGTKNGYTLSQNSEYTLSLDAFYRNQSGSIILTGNSPKVDIYLIGVNGTKVVSDNPLGQLIGKIEPAGTFQWFEQKQFNFLPAIKLVGKVGLRFVISNGFWNFSNISLKPASDPQFSPDEIQILIPNVEYHNELLQYKVEFFDINNNSANVNAVSTPTFFTGSAIDLGTLS